jgi:hypothetical protein
VQDGVFSFLFPLTLTLQLKISVSDHEVGTIMTTLGGPTQRSPQLSKRGCSRSWLWW